MAKATTKNEPEAKVDAATADPLELLAQLEAIDTGTIEIHYNTLKKERQAIDRKLRRLWSLLKQRDPNVNAARGKRRKKTEDQEPVKPNGQADAPAAATAAGQSLADRIAHRLNLQPARAPTLADDLDVDIESVMRAMRNDGKRFRQTTSGVWELIRQPKS